MPRGAERVAGDPVDEAAQLRLQRRDVELSLDVLQAVVQAGSRIALAPRPRRCIRARAERHVDEIARLQARARRHAIGIGLVERDRHQDIDDRAGPWSHRFGQIRAIGRLRKGVRKRGMPSSVSGRLGMPTAKSDHESRRSPPPMSRPRSRAGSPISAPSGGCRRRRSRPISATSRQFLAFLAEHLGGAPIAEAARQARRRATCAPSWRRGARDGIGSALADARRSPARARSRRFLERNGKGKVGGAHRRARAESAKTLPKPLPIAAAKRIADADLRAGEEREPWILARDAAVLGAALRLAACASPKRCAQARGRAGAGRGRRHHRHRQRQQDAHGAGAAAGAAAGRRLCRALPL